MYVWERRGMAQVVDDVDVSDVAMVPATYAPTTSANAPMLPVIGVTLSFFSTLMLFAMLMRGQS